MTDDTRNLQKYPPILFDEIRRREFIDPDICVELVDLQPGHRVADLGAGAGFFTIPVAKSIVPDGTVYAVDINPNNLSIIRGKAQHAGLLGSVELVEANAETGRGLGLPPGSIDVVILSSVLSQFEDKLKVLKTALSLLKKSGRLVIVEWHQRDMLLGPSPNSRISKEEVINLLFAEKTVKLYKDVDVGFYHYCLIFTKQ